MYWLLAPSNGRTWTWPSEVATRWRPLRLKVYLCRWTVRRIFCFWTERNVSNSKRCFYVFAGLLLSDVHLLGVGDNVYSSYTTLKHTYVSTHSQSWYTVLADSWKKSRISTNSFENWLKNDLNVKMWHMSDYSVVSTKFGLDECCWRFDIQKSVMHCEVLDPGVDRRFTWK